MFTMNILYRTAFVLAVIAAFRAGKDKDECKVQAWVRAEDLRPDHISHGELRVRVPHPEKCSSPIVSVSLRLQLDEFSEVKHLRRGAVLPEIREAQNQTISAYILNFFGTTPTQTVYDYREYDRAMSDPTFWVVKAEERRTWSTEAVLFRDDADFSQAKITSFIVAVPPVNYPPSHKTYRCSTSEPIRRHAFSALAYNYIAIVKFDDGQTLDVAAGHTTFVPGSQVSLHQKPFRWNATFVEEAGSGEVQLPETEDRAALEQKCLPSDLRSAVFSAEVTLDEGNVVQRGQPFTGKVVIHATNGSTRMSDIKATFRTFSNHQWAVKQAAIEGDSKFINDSCARRSLYSGVISPDSSEYLFEMKKTRAISIAPERWPGARGPITPTKPFFDFKLEVPRTAIPTFTSHYGSTEAELELELTVSYSRDAAVCIFGVKQVNSNDDLEAENKMLDDAAMTEEGLWDSRTPVGDVTAQTTYRYHSLRLKATVPLVVLSETSERPVEHYLTPNLPSPIILAAQGDSAPVVFPAAQPQSIEEALINTSARLMRSGGTFDPFETLRRLRFQPVPDPAKNYNQGNYAGLLWKKKVIAEERGLLPVPQSPDAAEVDPEDSQHRFLAALKEN